MSIGANAIMRPANAASAALIRAVPHFLGLRLSWTHESLKSEGMEKFIDESLPVIRSNNPDIKFTLYRSYTECDPFVVGEYAWSRHRKKRVSWKTQHQILSMVEEMMAHAGDYREGKRRCVNRRLPRGQEIWDTETMGHNVFEVYSKWKGDPKPRDEITWKNHPHIVYRKN
ncbi:hypothetical protein PMAYCL1PPCAC_07542 [Pristionchus mayeri]|uniref:Ribosomal protein/NADH dehydrogenase domain-containing protein n=1 Tax=Pristionchus mayeri TaxID=1317129 RepID=A0AAN4ZG90_9BILA|nr:hypothetical protein PMAYCL1PPCAC_07542 [Pristionchus mayeri]